MDTNTRTFGFIYIATGVISLLLSVFIYEGLIAVIFGIGAIIFFLVGTKRLKEHPARPNDATDPPHPQAT